jgi:hypothetical protein
MLTPKNLLLALALTTSVGASAQVSNTLTIQDADISHHVTIYPTPFSDEVNIKVRGLGSTEILVEILNTNGWVVANYSGEFNNEVTMDVSELPRGTYVIFVYHEGQTLCRRQVQKR